MTPARAYIALILPLSLAACAVAPPTGPSFYAMPAKGKDMAQFQGEDLNCRNYAQASIGGTTPAQASNQAAVGSAVVGTALGATAGALLGAAGGAAGTGAAVGAGAGLLTGSAIGANNAQTSSGNLQGRYDVAYAQCMTSAGNTVQAPPPAIAAYPVPAYGYAVPYAYPAYPYWGPSVSFGVYGGRGYWGRPWGHPYGWRRW
ncbi:glycine zipper family protein [Belnapia rosea]|uniref:glycine zipper family protein n=1 Tax=Belnapia rosea TaxID=938405 RepID=UPI00087E53B1|nr:glycine zipper family protein [Belnapia rosea]SDB65857.1 Glycine-zipper containing OmpA-like membrane domain-containing protein [Belnapia rosea]